MNQRKPTMKPNMEQQGNHTNSMVELQDLSIFNLNDSENATQRNHSGQGGVTNVNGGYLRNNLANNCNLSMSNEESKIRAELEADVEKNLEEEIKDGICHLALQLHRLYQHQSGRNARESSNSEVQITIKMDGGSKIEINEIKKVARVNPRPQISNEEGKQGMVFPRTKKFNWVDTLRSGNSLVHQVHPNIKHDMKGGRNWNSALTDRKRANWR
ncbi:hypothetical protein NE237_018508 [Protea cynaroides]|uniref:Uncharacterized protein n=1 Tax=Protea cynaroides TaxID=273540 RepID=A0A9Q0QP90_9MAGN|nr:hypothetical protein NE237_018508 [Protea cynaroides]